MNNKLKTKDLTFHTPFSKKGVTPKGGGFTHTPKGVTPKGGGFTHTPKGVTLKGGGFTLIELLVVVAIIGLLSSVVLSSLNTARAKARDARRLSDMRQIQIALALYHDDNGGNYPQENSSNGGWEDSTEDGGDFIDFLKDNGYMSTVPVDPINSGSTYYSYYVYPAGNDGCNLSSGEHYILGVRDMETSGIPHPSSPGFSCLNRDWQVEFDWVTGEFES